MLCSSVPGFVIQPVWHIRAVFTVFVTATMNHEHMAEIGHRITRPEFPDDQELLRESEIRSVADFLISIHISICCRFFFSSHISIFRELSGKLLAFYPGGI